MAVKRKSASTRKVQLPKAVTLDNYSDFRNKILRSSTRKLFPTKTELVDRNGKLKVSQQTIDELMEAANRVLNDGFSVSRDSKGRFTARSKIAIDRTIEQIKSNTSLSKDQKIRAAALEITLATMDETEKRQLQSRLKSSGAIRDKDYYAAKSYLLKDDSVFDIDEAEDAGALPALADALLSGEITVDEKTANEILKRAGYDVDDENEKRSETISSISSPVGSKISSIASEIRRSL